LQAWQNAKAGLNDAGSHAMIRKLIKIDENIEATAAVHSIEGTNKYVLELLFFGYAFASRYILLRSAATIKKLKENDDRVLTAIRQGGSSLGRIIKENELEYNAIEGCMCIKDLA
jgi:hypothetical protein